MGRINAKSAKEWPLVLRMRAQAERLYRRAVEDPHTRALRDSELPDDGVIAPPSARLSSAENRTRRTAYRRPGRPKRKIEHRHPIARQYQRSRIVEQSLDVQCYAGRKAGERPIRFRIGSRECLVEEIVEQWYGPEDSFFKVRADDGKRYVLRHHTLTDLWWAV